MPRLKSVPRSCHGYSKSVKDPHDQAKSLKEVKKEHHDLPEQCEDLKSFLSQALCDAWSSGATEQAQNHDERKELANKWNDHTLTYNSCAGWEFNLLLKYWTGSLQRDVQDLKRRSNADPQCRSPSVFRRRI